MVLGAVAIGVVRRDPRSKYCHEEQYSKNCARDDRPSVKELQYAGDSR